MGWSKMSRLSGIAMGIGCHFLNHSEPITGGLIECVHLLLRYFDNYPNIECRSEYKYTVYLPASTSSSNKLVVNYIPLRRRYKRGGPQKKSLLDPAACFHLSSFPSIVQALVAMIRPIL